MSLIEYDSPGWYFDEVHGPQPLPPITADSHAVALMGCPPLIGDVDGTGRWEEDQVRQRFACTPVAWFEATLTLQQAGSLTWSMVVPPEEDTLWRDVPLEDHMSASIDSAGILWLAQRFPPREEE
jgi:hypothetical protein